MKKKKFSEDADAAISELWKLAPPKKKEKKKKLGKKKEKKRNSSSKEMIPRLFKDRWVLQNGT